MHHTRTPLGWPRCHHVICVAMRYPFPASPLSALPPCMPSELHLLIPCLRPKHPPMRRGTCFPTPYGSQLPTSMTHKVIRLTQKLVASEAPAPSSPQQPPAAPPAPASSRQLLACPPVPALLSHSSGSWAPLANQICCPSPSFIHYSMHPSASQARSLHRRLPAYSLPRPYQPSLINSPLSILLHYPPIGGVV